MCPNYIFPVVNKARILWHRILFFFDRYFNGIEYDVYGSYSTSLYQGKDSIASFVLLVWCSLGDPSVVKETLLSWYDSFVKRKRKKVLRVAPLYIFWTIWWEPNQRAFENEEGTDQKLKLLFLSNLSTWVSMYIREGSMP